MRQKIILLDQASAIFRTLKAKISDDFQPEDETLLILLSNQIHLYNEANELIAERGLVLPGGSILRQNPAFQCVRESAKIIEALAGHFGLSPKTRKQPFKSKESEEPDLIAEFKEKFNK